MGASCLWKMTAVCVRREVIDYKTRDTGTLGVVESRNGVPSIVDDVRVSYA
jgi:hypothetical protein